MEDVRVNLDAFDAQIRKLGARRSERKQDLLRIALGVVRDCHQEKEEDDLAVLARICLSILRGRVLTKGDFKHALGLTAGVVMAYQQGSPEITDDALDELIEYYLEWPWIGAGCWGEGGPDV